MADIERMTLFLHTDDLPEETLAKMLSAGYLPVKVANLQAYRTIDHGLSLSRNELDAIGQSALQALVSHGDSQTKGAFVKYLAHALGVFKDLPDA